MNILVTGAAGYIGSVVTHELIKEGHSVFALDNLTRGHRKAIHPAASFILGDIGDSHTLNQLFSSYRIDAVIHLAAAVSVNESMCNPELYFRTNVIYGINLLNNMLKFNISKLIFSSTAAVYGNPPHCPVTENAPTLPLSPYGESKLIFEKILHWYHSAYKINYILFRYFNAAGASELYGCAHKNETLLIPNILKVALGQKEYIPIFGADYNTTDGTCIRDYIHVVDIAKAHILALKYLEKSHIKRCFNLGTAKGYSVLEVIDIAKKITKVNIPAVVNQRRPGDLPVIVASSELATEELGWVPEYSKLDDIIASAWKWQKEHPYGYDDNNIRENPPKQR